MIDPRADYDVMYRIYFIAEDATDPRWHVIPTRL